MIDDAKPNVALGEHDLDRQRSLLRWGVYGILIAASLGQISGRILAVNSVDKIRLEDYLKKQGRKDYQQQRPFLSGNDRSRWCTVRALVEHGTYAIDDIISQPNWDTIDMVKHRDREGVPRLYSSKPTLFPTLLAGEYWIIHKLTGKTLGTHPYEIGRFMLFTVNVLPLALMFWSLARCVERLGQSDWGRVFVMAAACFATFLPTFAVVINNHLIAAVSATLALDAATCIWQGDLRPRCFAVAGFFAAFTAANELPALAFLGMLGLWLLMAYPRQSLLYSAPAAALVAAAFFATEYAAHGEFRVAYAHRDKDKDWEQGNWYNYTYERNGKTITSYWANKATQSKVDQGEPSAATYALHALVGHHGIFSLSPMWLLMPLGLAMALRRLPGPASAWPDRYSRRNVAIVVGAVTLVCLAFYLSRDQPDRNYGGMTSALRWVFWFAPLWLAAMLPAVDWMSSRRWARWLSFVLLGFSALSAAYPTWNPWTQPWIVNFMIHMGWLDW